MATRLLHDPLVLPDRRLPRPRCPGLPFPQRGGEGHTPRYDSDRRAPAVVQSGFSVNLFATGLSGVRYLALGPGGAVYASLSDGGKIVRLPDANGDGVAEGPTTELSGLNYPFGLAFRGDTMYFAEMTAVQRLDPGATAPVTLVPTLPSGGHATRTLVIGPDNLMYVAVGSSCNICNDTPPRAAVTRYNLDGSNPHTF